MFSVAIYFYLFLTFICDALIVYGTQQLLGEQKLHPLIPLVSFVLSLLVSTYILRHRLTQKDVRWSVVYLFVLAVVGAFLTYGNENYSKLYIVPQVAASFLPLYLREKFAVRPNRV